MDRTFHLSNEIATRGSCRLPFLLGNGPFLSILLRGWLALQCGRLANNILDNIPPTCDLGEMIISNLNFINVRFYFLNTFTLNLK